MRRCRAAARGTGGVENPVGLRRHQECGEQKRSDRDDRRDLACRPHERQTKGGDRAGIGQTGRGQRVGQRQRGSPPRSRPQEPDPDEHRPHRAGARAGPLRTVFMCLRIWRDAVPARRLLCGTPSPTWRRPPEVRSLVRRTARETAAPLRPCPFNTPRCLRRGRPPAARPNHQRAPEGSDPLATWRAVANSSADTASSLRTLSCATY